ncbi:hypothetical protein ACG5V6_04730 [Streptomyces chitinivorans]|uniref:XRE family transcriptional regulator n=1 Tax=Streptomyces chitinivorans TaxID=1257027 RepID=A0ABW7HNS1_9ACTN|nr:hypothetical protein [Streptomyces chitinivorans]MDH2411807.1 hypothetical protein [Streptomyces chitinivorans]
MSNHHFNVVALRRRLDFHRKWRKIAWRQVAAETGLNPVVLTGIIRGQAPSVDDLVTLMMWLGETDIVPFVTPGGTVDG